MGKLKNGLHGIFTGRIGNKVYYVLNGENLNPSTEKQLKTRAEIKLVGQFFRTLSAFIKVGFSTESFGSGLNPYRLGCS